MEMIHCTGLQRASVLQVWPAVVEVAAGGGTLCFSSLQTLKKCRVQSQFCKKGFSTQLFNFKIQEHDKRWNHAAKELYFQLVRGIGDCVYMQSIHRLRSIFSLKEQCKWDVYMHSSYGNIPLLHVSQHILNKPELGTTIGKKVWWSLT